MSDQKHLTPESQQPVKTGVVKGKALWIIIGVAGIVVLIGGVLAYLLLSNKPLETEDTTDETTTNEDTTYNPTGEFSETFATYQETSVKVNPSVPAYSVQADLSNVSNASEYDFSAKSKEYLSKNAFVVIPGTAYEFFSVYESNRYNSIPNFVTTDSMLHNYHLLFNALLEQVEKDKLIPELNGLNASMLTAASNQYDALKGTDWENAAKRNVAFFTVGSKLLDPKVKTPKYVKDEVDQELALIEAHAQITASPIMNLGATKDDEIYLEDYSQYVPRGHYDKTDELKAYFKSMMWYGRLTFLLSKDDQVKSSILMTLALNEGKNQLGWNNIYEPVNFFVGKSDDITYYQLKEIVDDVYGQNSTLESIIQDEDKFAIFVAATKKLDPPQINSMAIFQTQSEEEKEAAIKGFRFMGQRFTIDAAIFQQLIHSKVSGRMLPKGLDIPAAFGSAEALDLLTESGDTNFENYSTNMARMQSYVSDLPTETWTQNLYWGWLYTLNPLVSEKPAGYPTFMRNQAWVRKELNTFLGSWTELKHDTILYAKQAYAELGGMPEEEFDDRGYVEPNPELYARLASLTKMTREGLESRDLLNDDMKENLGIMEELALSLKTISEKELNNQKLSDDDYELIRSYGGQLEELWYQVNKEDMEAVGASIINYLDDNPAALVADVATDPNGSVLEEATGYISDIYVIVPIEGKLKITKGGVYSYYEFAWPLSDRLTDSAWRQMLYDGEAPELPAWTSLFVK